MPLHEGIEFVRAFDPGRTTGWCLVRVADLKPIDGGRLVEPGKPGVDGEPTWCVYQRRLTALALSQAGIASRTLTVLEAGFAPRSAVTINAALSLQRRIGELRRAFWSPGAPEPVLVPNTTWKAALGLPLKDAVDAYIQQAETLLRRYGASVPDWYASGDRAAATCLGWWAASRVQRGQPLAFTEEEQRERARDAARARAGRWPDGWLDGRTAGGHVEEQDGRWIGFVGAEQLRTGSGAPRSFGSGPAAARAVDALLRSV